VHPSNNAFSYHNLEIACYFWDYVIAYEYFLAKADFIHMLQMSMIILFLSNRDSIYNYVFPLMTNVVFWEYPIKNVIGLSLITRTCYLDGPLFNNPGNIGVIFPKINDALFELCCVIKAQRLIKIGHSNEP
jgi:hypothetical protein